MGFAKDDEVIEALIPDGLDEALSVRVAVGLCAGMATLVMPSLARSSAAITRADAEDVLRQRSQNGPNILRELFVRSAQHTDCSSDFAREWPRS